MYDLYCTAHGRPKELDRLASVMDLDRHMKAISVQFDMITLYMVRVVWEQMPPKSVVSERHLAKALRPVVACERWVELE